jgi:hypothetical protein
MKSSLRIFVQVISLISTSNALISKNSQAPHGRYPVMNGCIPDYCLGQPFAFQNFSQAGDVIPLFRAILSS